MHAFVRTVLGTAIVLAPLVVAMLYATPSRAQQCISIHQAQGMMKASHLTVVGVLPFHEGRALYYREGKHLFAAPIDGGCVSPGGVPVQRRPAVTIVRPDGGSGVAPPARRSGRVAGGVYA